MDRIRAVEKRIPDWLLPAAIIVLGAVVRLVALGSMPGGMHQDESFVAWNAYAIFHEGMDSAGNIMPVYMADWGDGHSALYVWLTLPFIALNGGHVTPFISRLPQAIVSILTLVALQGILQRVGTRRLALWGSFLLAVCPWHICMSRWGLDANLAPGFLVFGLYFFLRGLEKKPFLLLAAFFYGLTLYSYAICYLTVPLVLLLQIGYALRTKKLRVDRWSILSAILLFVIALPLLLFVAVNQGLLAPIQLSFLTIPSMSGYRGGEIAFRFSDLWSNLRKTLSLLWHQNTGAPYDILLPWGLFYDIGRVLAVFGAICLTVKTVLGIRKKEYTPETFLLIQLLGGGIVCMLVTAVLHQINALYIPIVLCEGYGVCCIIGFVERMVKAKAAREEKASGAAGKVLPVMTAAVIAGVYLFCFAGFLRDYYGSYRTLVNAYFGEGIQECVELAVQTCNDRNIDTITVEKGAQWPRLLLFTETLPSEYLSSVEYDVAPAPASFRTGDILVRTRIDYEAISQESIYIIYYTDEALFSEQFELYRFGDWFTAIPKA